ncbi:hypothetical protein P691DRAFT_710364 [Macrolepiota fuliginosa MF-IS2]|uniref:F-box domain-containing protein n=1 Tax=Macrolepiota fuliginosa MF-IS2 TaxID=1400762 RepID=A0A9P6C193_9AGAR|nr:hypothetical protein P691DRAFT_710364 [Macrolepiota fuliginosa MF-IS2]
MSANSSLVPSAVEMKVTLLDLPSEILTRILLYLPFTSVVTCTEVNRRLRSLVSSTELQYYIHLGMAGLVNNPHCGISYPERLDQLLTRERRWEELDFDFDKTIDVAFTNQNNMIKLSGGVFSVVNARRDFHYMQLPSGPDQEIEWKWAHLEQVIIMTTCAFEYDLSAIVTARSQTVATNPGQFPARYEVQLHLLQILTGGPHPEARQGVISFETLYELIDLRASIIISGDDAVLVLWEGQPRGTHEPDDQVYVYNWKTGELKMQFSAPRGSYGWTLFLTTDIFLLPNRRTGELEYWRIPQNISEPVPHQPFFALSLPPLRPNKTFSSIYCRARPNPSKGPRNTSKPFYLDPHHAVATFHVTIRPDDNPWFRPSFIFFVHRSSLIGYLHTFSGFISPNDRPIPVPYSDWGPDTCRWLTVGLSGWAGTAYGQRYITQSTNAERDGSPLTLFNFNQINVARVLGAGGHGLRAKVQSGVTIGNVGKNEIYTSVGQEKAQDCTGERLSEDIGEEKRHNAKAGEEGDPSFSELRLNENIVIRSRDPLEDPEHCFEDVVYSSLPYTVCKSTEKYSFRGLLLDEERILGLSVGPWADIKGVHVFHCG